jgi:hypothetical protein
MRTRIEMRKARNKRSVWLISVKHFPGDLLKIPAVSTCSSFTDSGSLTSPTQFTDFDMHTSRDTDQAISTLIEAAGMRTAREQYLYRQSLLALVRLAKAEQMNEVRANVGMLIGAPAYAAP